MVGKPLLDWVCSTVLRSRLWRGINERRCAYNCALDQQNFQGSRRVSATTEHLFTRIHESKNHCMHEIRSSSTPLEQIASPPRAHSRKQPPPRSVLVHSSSTSICACLFDRDRGSLFRCSIMILPTATRLQNMLCELYWDCVARSPALLRAWHLQCTARRIPNKGTQRVRRVHRRAYATLEHRTDP